MYQDPNGRNLSYFDHTLLPYHVDTLTKMVTPERSEMDSQVFHFKGVTDIYGTVPRRRRHWGTPPAPKPPSTIASSRRYGSSHTLCQDAQSRRSQRFSQLLEFTKQQSVFAAQPSKLLDAAQSLPPSGPHLFSPQREVVVEEMENATVPFPEAKPQEIPSQDVSSIDQLHSTTDKIPIVPHIKGSSLVGDSEPPAKGDVTKSEGEPMSVDRREEVLPSKMKGEAITNLPPETTANVPPETTDVTGDSKEQLAHQEQARVSQTTPHTSDELRQRLPPQHPLPLVTENHPTRKPNEDQDTAVEPVRGAIASVTNPRRVGLLPTILRWGLVIVGIGVVAYLGYLGYSALESSYSAAASSRTL